VRKWVVEQPMLDSRKLYLLVQMGFQILGCGTKELDSTGGHLQRLAAYPQRSPTGSASLIRVQSLQ
jgi:hypothetical protein